MLSKINFVTLIDFVQRCSTLHKDYVNGKKEDGLVQGTAAVVYLHSAPDGQSVGSLLFKNQAGRVRISSLRYIVAVIIEPRFHLCSLIGVEFH